MSAKWISTFIWWWLFVEWDRWEVGVWRPGDANSMVSCNWRKCRPCVNLLCHAPQDLNYSKLLVCRFRFFPNTGLARLAVLWLENTSVSAFCWMLQLFLSFFFSHWGFGWRQITAGSGFGGLHLWLQLWQKILFVWELSCQNEPAL